MSKKALTALLALFQATFALATEPTRPSLQEKTLERLHQDRALVDQARNLAHELEDRFLKGASQEELDQLGLQLKEVEESLEKCPICLDELRFLKFIISSDCNHLFCRECFREDKLYELRKCPLCRSLHWRGNLVVVTYPCMQDLN